MLSAEERRRFKRFNIRLPVKVAPAAVAGAISYGGETADASLGGLRLHLERTENFSPGQEVVLAIDSLSAREPVEAKGRIRWMGASPDPSWSWEVGVELTGMGKVHWDNWFQILPWV